MQVGDEGVIQKIGRKVHKENIFLDFLFFKMGKEIAQYVQKGLPWWRNH